MEIRVEEKPLSQTSYQEIDGHFPFSPSQSQQAHLSTSSENIIIYDTFRYDSSFELNGLLSPVEDTNESQEQVLLANKENSQSKDIFDHFIDKCYSDKLDKTKENIVERSEYVPSKSSLNVTSAHEMSQTFPNFQDNKHTGTISNIHNNNNINRGISASPYTDHKPIELEVEQEISHGLTSKFANKSIEPTETKKTPMDSKYSTASHTKSGKSQQILSASKSKSLNTLLNGSNKRVESWKIGKDETIINNHKNENDYFYSPKINLNVNKVMNTDLQEVKIIDLCDDDDDDIAENSSTKPKIKPKNRFTGEKNHLSNNKDKMVDETKFPKYVESEDTDNLGDGNLDILESTQLSTCGKVLRQIEQRKNEIDECLQTQPKRPLSSFLDGDSQSSQEDRDTSIIKRKYPDFLKKRRNDIYSEQILRLTQNPSEKDKNDCISPILNEGFENNNNNKSMDIEKTSGIIEFEKISEIEELIENVDCSKSEKGLNINTKIQEKNKIEIHDIDSSLKKQTKQSNEEFDKIDNPIRNKSIPGREISITDKSSKNQKISEKPRNYNCQEEKIILNRQNYTTTSTLNLIIKPKKREKKLDENMGSIEKFLTYPKNTDIIPTRRLAEERKRKKEESSGGWMSKLSDEWVNEPVRIGKKKAEGKFNF